MSIKITSDNPNYLAKLVILSDVRKHNNADRLQCVAIDGNNIITSLEAKNGDRYVYFPPECAINKEFIAYINFFSEPELNKDGKTKGFFNKHGRVRVISLRGERSEGFIIPAVKIENFINDAGHSFNFQVTDENVYFDTIFDIVICKKYVNENVLKLQEQRAAREKNRQNRKVVRVSRLIENQFRLSEDTLHLKKLIAKINPDDNITIAYKMHGTNTSIGKVLVKKKLKLHEKFLKKIGIPIIDSHYDTVIASRRVIKNEFADQQTNNYYEEDIWMRAAERIKDKLKDGITVHAEIVGHLSTGKFIQNGYDYGCEPNDFDIYVYRMFYTSPAGDVFEFTTPQLIKYCERVGLKTVPIFFSGKAKDLYPGFTVAGHWHNNFLECLIRDYTEKDCYMCLNKVPEEGICLIKNDDYFTAFKLKSFRFLQRETEELDKTDEINIEDVG